MPSPLPPHPGTTDARLRTDVFAGLPPAWPQDLLPGIRERVAADPSRKLVVLDDDPTGTQTVYDIPVLTQWDTSVLERELVGPAPGFYLLTNSRSLTRARARELNLRTARELMTAATKIHCDITVVSRSDSTLRGHYPLETDALTEVLGPYDGVWLIPYFEAGGRYTIDGVHYVLEGEQLVPASETPFARDPVFGFRKAALAAYVEEKTGGKTTAGDVVEITLDQLRHGGPEAVVRRLLELQSGFTGFINAAAPGDLEVFVAAVLRAEQQGRRYLFRTAAQFVATRLGLAPRPMWSPSASGGGQLGGGGLTVVGSHVPKTTTQLNSLLGLEDQALVELKVPALLDPRTREPHLGQVAEEINRLLAQERDVTVATSRELIAGADPEANLQISRSVSESLVFLVRELKQRPRFLVAKGGITASDVATRGLGIRRAMVLGQILPGIPVWELGPETRFPGLPYVVFPGNVGGPEALRDAVVKLRGKATDPRPLISKSVGEPSRCSESAHREEPL